MIPESTVHITDKPLSSAVSLREGSFVFVRVIGEKPDGTYEVSFAGNRFSVRADKPLSAGDAFPARLATDGRKLILLPDYSRFLGRDFSRDFGRSSNNSNIFDINSLSEADAARYFASLGLVPDELSRRIVSFMQLMGLRLDGDKAAFIRDIAKKFPGHEQEAAEAAVILEEKGIPVTEEAIEKLMGMIAGCGSAENGFTAQVNAVDERENWIIIPYEYTGGEQYSSFSGSMCILKRNDGTVPRIKITARKADNFFVFRIYLNYCENKTKIDESVVKFSMQNKTGGARKLEAKLKAALAGVANKVQVQYEEIENVMYLSDNEIALVRAEA